MSRALLCCALVACGGMDPGAPEVDDLSAPPSPFVLQFSGTYDGPAGQLALGRDGSYKLDGKRGRFRASRSRKSLPLTLTLGHRTATIEAYDGTLHLDGTALQLERPTASDEDLCDATQGQWTDDDADPATGLYCICRGGDFIPASGGCVP
jgi:hypothetical protein